MTNLNKNYTKLSTKYGCVLIKNPFPSTGGKKEYIAIPITLYNKVSDKLNDANTSEEEKITLLHYCHIIIQTKCKNLNKSDDRIIPDYINDGLKRILGIVGEVEYIYDSIAHHFDYILAVLFTYVFSNIITLKGSNLWCYIYIIHYHVLDVQR